MWQNIPKLFKIILQNANQSTKLSRPNEPQPEQKIDIEFRNQRAAVICTWYSIPECAGPSETEARQKIDRQWREKEQDKENTC